MLFDNPSDLTDLMPTKAAVPFQSHRAKPKLRLRAFFFYMNVCRFIGII